MQYKLMSKVRLLCGIGILLAITSLVWGQSIWEGNAIVGSDIQYQRDTSITAWSNAFTPNSTVRITNLENGKTIRLTIKGRINAPGVFAILSVPAARALDIVESSPTRIRATPISSAVSSLNSLVEQPYQTNELPPLSQSQSVLPPQFSQPLPESTIPVTSIPSQVSPIEPAILPTVSSIATPSLPTVAGPVYPSPDPPQLANTEVPESLASLPAADPVPQVSSISGPSRIPQPVAPQVTEPEYRGATDTPAARSLSDTRIPSYARSSDLNIVPLEPQFESYYTPEDTSIARVDPRDSDIVNGILSQPKIANVPPAAAPPDPEPEAPPSINTLTPTTIAVPTAEVGTLQSLDTYRYNNQSTPYIIVEPRVTSPPLPTIPAETVPDTSTMLDTSDMLEDFEESAIPSISYQPRFPNNFDSFEIPEPSVRIPPEEEPNDTNVSSFTGEIAQGITAPIVIPEIDIPSGSVLDGLQDLTNNLVTRSAAPSVPSAPPALIENGPLADEDVSEAEINGAIQDLAAQIPNTLLTEIPQADRIFTFLDAPDNPRLNQKILDSLSPPFLTPEPQIGTLSDSPRDPNSVSSTPFPQAELADTAVSLPDETRTPFPTEADTLSADSSAAPYDYTFDAESRPEAEQLPDIEIASVTDVFHPGPVASYIGDISRPQSFDISSHIPDDRSIPSVDITPEVTDGDTSEDTMEETPIVQPPPAEAPVEESPIVEASPAEAPEDTTHIDPLSIPEDDYHVFLEPTDPSSPPASSTRSSIPPAIAQPNLNIPSGTTISPASRVPVPTVTLVPAPSSPPVSSAPAPAPVSPAPTPTPAPPISEAEASLPLIESVQHNSFYMQVGAFFSAEGARAVITQLEKYQYPLSVLKNERNNRPLYQVLVGPLTEDEKGMALYRLQAQGYQDAFVKKGSDIL